MLARSRGAGLVAATLLAALMLADAVSGTARADAVEMFEPAETVYAADAISRTVKLGLNKALVIDLPRDARDVLISNPAIADAVK